jgi:glucuronate isomerase
MLTEMAAMSIDDGLVMQIHPGAFRNHNDAVFAAFGRDKGADMPMRTDYVHALKPLLDRYRQRPSSFRSFSSRSTKAPMPANWRRWPGTIRASSSGRPGGSTTAPEGMRRFRRMTTETAGFYNTVGFNDDTRAFLSIPARHDVARRIDCGFLAELVAEHRLADWEAAELAADLVVQPRQGGVSL